MTPFVQFRVWLRRGPSGERAAAGVASVVVLALVVWATIPVHEVRLAVGGPGPATAGQVGAAEGGPAAAPGEAPVKEAGAAGSAAAGSTRVTSVPAAGPRAGGPAARGQGTALCSGLRATDQGVSPTETFVAVSLVNLAGDVVNQTFGIRSDLEAVAQAVAAGINEEGGVACRRLRIKTYRVNPLDPNDQRSKCLEIVGDKPFAVIDLAGYLSPVARSCFVENKIPYQQGDALINEDEAAGAQPFMYSALTSDDRGARNWVFDVAARGWFDPKKGFRKLGLLLDECNPKANAELEANLTKVGVPDKQRSTFTLGSCASIASPSEITQALVQHRNAGVSHVFLASNNSNNQAYVRQADRIHWKPVFMASDFGFATSSISANNFPDGFDGTVAITSTRDGEINSGMINAQVVRCEEWMKKKHVPPPTKEADYALNLCDQFRLFAAAANAAGPNLVRTTLVGGLAKIGRFETAYLGDGLYDRPGKVWGGDFIRAIQWHLNCKCWKVLERVMKPGH